MRVCVKGKFGLILLTLSFIIILGQSCYAQPANPGGGMRAGAAGRGGGRGMTSPKAGVAPLPILAALPASNDTDFYAK